MSKKMLLRLLAVASFLVAAVLWLLSVLMEEQFGWFNLSWAVVVLAGVNGVALLLSAVFTKGVVPLKKMYLFASAALLIVAGVSIAFAIALPKNLIWPIIAVILAVMLVLGVLVTGGKKWDEGDNQKAGYKNYRQRKAKEEKENKQDEE